MVDLWNCVGQAANIAQLTGVDAAGLVSMILTAVQTVRRNKGDCQLLASRVTKISKILEHLQSQGMMQDGNVWKPLDGIQDTLREAYVLVASCQNSSAMRRFFMCGKEANQFREVQRRIDGYIELYPVVMHLDISQRLDRLGNGANAPSSSEPRRRGRENGPVMLSTRKHRSIWVCWKHHRKNSPLSVQHDGSGYSITTFGLSKLTRATNNFSDKIYMRCDGSGNVYKGQMDDGLEVAVKRYYFASIYAKAFNDEVQILTTLHHNNVVKLLGYCIEQGEMILVYEYFPNGSLEKLIFDKTETPLLWPIRFRIIKGITQGITYLHEHCGTPIMHGDIKPSNILLDSSMNPAIFDFGVSKLVVPGAEQEDYQIQGTYGYIDPVLCFGGKYSTKADVYSFGVMLIEIITGKRNVDLTSNKLLIDYARELWLAGRASEIIDPSLQSEDHMTQILRCIQIGLLCVEPDRPSMWDVLIMLSCENANVPAPQEGAQGVLYESMSP